MTKSVITVENLGKEYVIGSRERNENFREMIVSAMAAPFRRLNRLSGKVAQEERIWALRNVGFDVREGEVLGIIGRNGAGKSTLLKILSRITAPTEGCVQIRGRVSSLLEVGTGFHPELTGRENIYLNGAILGMSRAEIDRKFDEIVDFSGVERFLDTPVKRYSSGMSVRLAFAVAAHLEPEILIVDEVLAVGDAEFQNKCIGKMQNFGGEGRTIIFVSHNTAAVRQLCQRCLVIENGGIEFDGRVGEAINYYEESESTPSETTVWKRLQYDPNTKFCFSRIEAELYGSQPDLSLVCKIFVDCLAAAPPAFIAVDISDRIKNPIMQALPKAEPFIIGKPGRHCIDLTIYLPPLIPGLYTTQFWVGASFTETFDTVSDKISFCVGGSPTEGRIYPHTRDHGFMVPRTDYDYRFNNLVSEDGVA